MRPVFYHTERDEQFSKDGFVVLKNAVPPLLLNKLTAFYQQIDVQAKDAFTLTNLLNDIPLRKKIHAGLQEHLVLWSSLFIRHMRYVLGTLAIKPPGQNTSFSVHQDWSLVDERSFLSLSIWIPVVNTNDNNGCFRVLKGSHQYFSHPRGMNIPYPYEGYSQALAEQYMTPIPMQAGDVLIFDHRLVHDSGPNKSSDTRAAAVAAFIPQETELFHYYRHAGTHQIDCYQLPADFLIDNNFFAYDQPPAVGTVIEQMVYADPAIDFEKFKTLYAQTVL